MRGKSIVLFACAALFLSASCASEADDATRCQTGCGGDGGGSAGAGGEGGSGGDGGGSAGAGGEGGSGGAGGGNDEKWSAPLDLCDSHFMPKAQIDPFPMLASVGPTPALEDGFSAVGKLVGFESTRADFSFEALGRTVSIKWPRPFEQIWVENVGDEFQVTFDRGWLTIQAVGIEVVSVLHVETGRNPPNRIDQPLPGVGPTFHPQLQCAVTEDACSERAIQLEIHLDGKDPVMNWSGWGGGIENWNLSNWSRIRTGDCDQNYAIVIGGEGYLFLRK